MRIKTGLFCVLAAMIMILVALFAEDLAAQTGPADTGKLTRLRSQDGFIKDGLGRVTLLRGANVPSHCYKPMKFGPADLDALQGFGFNFIRLGVSWDKAEPEQGQVDMDYVRSLVEFARLAGERGIYVMPEVHKYGMCQEGSDWPKWACAVPVKSGSDTVGMMRNARRFWNSPELQGKLIDFWKLLVVEFRGLDNVMGYNPINEPLEISMIVPGLFDKKLFAFYEKWITAVRELDPGRPACLEPATINMIIPFMPPRIGHDNLVYAPHPYYIHSGSFVLKEPDAVLDMKYKRIDREARRLDAPLIIGEYGGDPDTGYARGWLTRSFELQDKYFAGAAIWVYDASDTGWAIVDSDLKPRPFFAKALNRPYPRHTAGKPLELKYEVESRAFTYRYAPDHKISAPTVIYLPSGPDQAMVSIKGGTWTYDRESRVLLVRPDAGAAEVLIEARVP